MQSENAKPETTSPHITERHGAGVVIHLWRLERESGDCPMCDRYRHLTHAVGWYCGPVRQDPGEHVPGWRGEAVAGGMPVCRECHDGFYAEVVNQDGKP